MGSRRSEVPSVSFMIEVCERKDDAVAPVGWERVDVLCSYAEGTCVSLTLASLFCSASESVRSRI